MPSRVPLPDNPFKRAQSFVSGGRPKNLLRVRYWRLDGKNCIIADVHFGPLAQGPPRRAHGGAIAAVLDESMGAAVWLLGRTAFTFKLEVFFLKGVPLKKHLNVMARVHRVRGRKLYATAQLTLGSGEVLAHARAVFVMADFIPGRTPKQARIKNSP